MIPKLSLQESLKPDTARFLEALAKTPFSGEMRGDFASRLMLSTDNSIYQILPQAVVFPRTSKDLIHLFQLANQAPFQNITFSPRGGGTGTNGQSLSSGIILDCSKYMNRILEVNLEAGWVRVQPGVVLDQLNADLKSEGVFFAPSLAPSNRATLGGMINTDACGQGSRIYGRTSDHILELTWVLSDGAVGRSYSVNLDTLTELKQQSGRLGQIYRQVDEIVASKRELIEQTFPKMPRFMTGYNLAKVYSEGRDSFNLNRILAGSEGTLAVITEAKLKLTKIPRFKQLLAIHYRCFDDALWATEALLALEPTAIETIDEKILAIAQQDEIYNRVKDFIADAKVINLVEFTGDTLAQLKQKVSQLGRRLESNQAQPQQAIGYYLAEDEEEMINLWALRKRGVGLLGNRQGARKPIAFIEDTAVPPACLFRYIREFKALLNEYQLDYAMFGHVDVGCVHVRPALDMKAPDDEGLIRDVSDRVVELVRKYGGVMWGEHGKGFRSEYTPVFFGEELYQDLRKIKAAFDPENKLNPGKIVTPYGASAATVQLEAPLRGHFDRQVSTSAQSNYETAFSCNGNGACFNFNPDDVMCPSYKGMCDRIHSPKGRASLLREWLRRLEAAKVEPFERPGSFPVKVWNTLTQAWGVYDYSHEVYAGMHGCLSCKACANQCPIHVDIPSLKSKFLALYYTRYLRPWRDYLIANIETIANWQSRAPTLVNLAIQNLLTRRFVKQFMGLTDLPVVSPLTLRQGLATRQAPIFDLATLSRLSEADRRNSVILLQDAFTSFYESPLVLDAYDFLRQLGYTVYVSPFFASGKLLHVRGFLPQFRAVVQKNTPYLSSMEALGMPIIGIEPSIVLTYRDEYEQFGDSTETSLGVQLLQAFLVQQCDRIAKAFQTQSRPQTISSQPYVLFGHCTEKTAAWASGQQWRQVFQAAGLTLNLVSTGCCGMAGIYGHEIEHYPTSKGIYEMSWGRHLPSNPEERQQILATGYSCRSQVKRFEGWIPLHPIQALLQQMPTP